MVRQSISVRARLVSLHVYGKLSCIAVLYAPVIHNDERSRYAALDTPYQLIPDELLSLLRLCLIVSH